MKPTYIPVAVLQGDHPLLAYLNSLFEGKGEIRVVYRPSPFPKPSKDAYSLEIEKGEIQMSGNPANALSFLYGLGVEQDHQSYLPLGHYEGDARFPWRGVLLDEARHFMGKAFVKNLLDTMFLLHYNVFHWHLSDDQGFRIALEKYPRLLSSSRRKGTLEGWGTGKKNWVEGPYSFAYSEEDIQEILLYAKDRGIEVVPEIDMPGHLSAILSAYPEYSCAKKPFDIPTSFGIFDHTLCLGNPEARKFMKELVEEAAYFFKAHYFHLGFDEIKPTAMKDCPLCQKRIEEENLKNEQGLIQDFQKELRQDLRQRDIVPLFWNDGFHRKDEDAIMEVWELVKPGNKRRAIRLINEGQKAIISPFFSTYASNPYCLMPLKKTFRFEPILAGIKRPQNVLGSELCYWSEYYRSPEKFAFEFNARAVILSATLWGIPKGNYKDFIGDWQAKSNRYFKESFPFDTPTTNPKAWARLPHFLAYSKDVDSEFKRRD
jgi:hexosaminidase